MDLIKALLIILVLVLSLPLGYLLAHLCREELVKGRKWFRYLIILSLIGAIGSYLFGIYESALTFVFISVVAIVSYIKSSNKNWTKRRI